MSRAAAPPRLLALVPLLVLSGCAGTPPPTPTAVPAAATAGKTVGVVRPTQGAVSRTLTQPATVQGLDEAVLYARASGYLKNIFVDKGDRVRAGQLLAVIESPELMHQQAQAQSTYEQSLASAQGVVASRRRAQADVAQAASGVAKARADADQASAAAAKARADQARTEAQLPRLQALVQEAEANVEQAQEQAAQAQADVARWQQQIRAAQASMRAAQAVQSRAEADARLQQATYNRYKAIQDKDAGLIPAQQVDEARARMETSRSEVDAARSKLEVAKDDLAGVEQQVEGARRAAAAAGRKVEAARSRAQAAREEVNAAKQDVEAARQQVKVAEAQIGSAKSQIGVAEAQRRALGEQVHAVDAQVAAARRQAEGNRSAMETAGSLASFTRITAPFDGVVTERMADPGAFVQNANGNQSSARGLLKIVRDRSVRVMIPVPEASIPSIRKGQAARIELDAYPKEALAGTVTRFASAVDPRSRTMLTEVVIPNPAGKVRPGMYARVTLTLETHTSALSIPSAALMGKEDRFVYLVEGGKAHKTPVTVGVDDGKMAEITTGLSADSQVVLVGQDTLVDGAPVKAEPAKVEPAKK